MLYTHTHTHTIHLENEKKDKENKKGTIKSETNIEKLDKSKKVHEENEDRTMFSKNKESAITLIALVITIIVLLILAGVSIATLTGTNGILTQAQKSKMTTELSSYKEQLELYKTEKLSENREFLESTLTVGKENLTYNTQPTGETGNIKTVIPNIKDEYMDKIEVIKGALLINTQDKNEIEIAKSLGIAANPYDIVNGELLSSNGNLLLMDETGTLTIPDSATKIGVGAFANLDGLKTIIIPGTVKEIGPEAFAYNQTLENVIMQEGVEIIGDAAFSGCLNLKNISMPASLIDIGGSCFYNCRGLTRIEVPEKIKEIKGTTFSLCTNLANIEFKGENITKIMGEAFFGCPITNFRIGKNVVEISDTAFSGCNNLINIGIENNNFYYKKGFLITADNESILFVSKQYFTNTEELIIPEGVKNFNVSIEDFNNITTLRVPNSVISINVKRLTKTIDNIIIDENNPNYKVEEKCIYSKNGEHLVYCFSKEQNIQLKGSPKTLDENSFYGAINAKKITLPDSVEKIGWQVFYSLTELEQLNIGKNVNSIGGYMCPYTLNCKVSIDLQNPNYMVENQVIYSKDKERLVMVCYKIQGEYQVDKTVKIIEDSSFVLQKDMTDIVFNSSLNIIGRAFTECKKLTKIEIPVNVENINFKAFEECTNLSTININKKEGSITGAPWGAPKGMKVVNWNG